MPVSSWAEISAHSCSLRTTTALPSPFLINILITCVDARCLGAEGAKKAATEPAMASVLTTVPFIVTAEAVRFQEQTLGRYVCAHTQRRCTVWC